MTVNSYADRARHYRAQAATARAGGNLPTARHLDALARRAVRAHAAHTPVTLDRIVAVAAQLEHHRGRALTIEESSAVKAAYQATCAGDGSYATLLRELAHRHMTWTNTTQGWAA